MKKKLSEQELDAIMMLADHNGAGKFDSTDFINTFGDKTRREDKCRLIFRMFDLNGDSFIDQKNIEKGIQILGIVSDSDVSDRKRLEKLLGKSIRDNDGQIDYDEFKKIYKIFYEADDNDSEDIDNKSSSDEKSSNESRLDESEDKNDAAVAFFEKYDLNGDGFIDKNELEEILIDIERKRGGRILPRRFLEPMMRYADEDRDGKISLDEFIKLWGKKVNSDYTSYSENHMRAHFRMHDSDGDGFIVKEDIERDFKVMFGDFSNFRKADVDELFQEADHDGDGKLNLDEYKRIYSIYETTFMKPDLFWQISHYDNSDLKDSSESDTDSDSE